MGLINAEQLIRRHEIRLELWDMKKLGYMNEVKK